MHYYKPLNLFPFCMTQVPNMSKNIKKESWYSVVVVQNVAPGDMLLWGGLSLCSEVRTSGWCGVAYFEAQKGWETGSKSYNNSSKWFELGHSHWTFIPQWCAEAAASLRGHKKYRATCIKYLSKKLVRTCVLYIASQTSFNTWTSHLEGIDNHW